MGSGRESPERKAEMEKEIFKELNTLMSQLIETGAEWTTQRRQQVRDQVNSLLQALCVKGFDDPEYEEIAARIVMGEVKVKTPDGYPSHEEFIRTYKELLPKEIQFPEEECRSDPTLEEFMRKAYTQWDKIRHRGSGEIEEYLYELGKILSDRFAYDTLFPEGDEISVNSKWHIENGRHRCLVLKCLGSEFIKKAKMDEYIKPV